MKNHLLTLLVSLFFSSCVNIVEKECAEFPLKLTSENHSFELIENHSFEAIRFTDKAGQTLTEIKPVKNSKNFIYKDFVDEIQTIKNIDTLYFKITSVQNNIKIKRDYSGRIFKNPDVAPKTIYPNVR